MRTDSVNLSDDARKAAQDEITSVYGSEYSKPENSSQSLKEHKKLMKLFAQRKWTNIRFQ